MTVLRNNFDGGVNGDAITAANSGAFGQDAFDAVQDDTPKALIQFAGVDVNGLNRSTAEFVMATATASNAAAGNVVVAAWTTSMGSQSEFWTRFYLYLSSLASNISDQNIFAAAGAGSDGMGIWVMSTAPTRTIQIRDLNGTGTTRNTSTTALTAGQWLRIELHATFTSVRGTSSSEMRLFMDDNVDTDTPTEIVSQTGGDYGVLPASQYFVGAAWDPVQKSQPNTFWSNWELNNIDWPGPSPFRAGKGVPGILTNPISIHSD